MEGRVHGVESWDVGVSAIPEQRVDYLDSTLVGRVEQERVSVRVLQVHHRTVSVHEFLDDRLLIQLDCFQELAFLEGPGSLLRCGGRCLGGYS